MIRKVIPMATKVNTHEAKTHLSQLLARVQAGEEIVIARAGTPVARLVPMESRVGNRQPGTAVGRIEMADDFDAPLPEELLDAFER
jgi:prevent-host-death family protein